MIVMVVTACPPSVRGDLSRWLFEVSTGVFVGHVSARVREALWTRVTAFVNDGKAIMAYSASNEQHVAFRVHRSSWKPRDCDGLVLMARPSGCEDESYYGARKSGWSDASKRHKARRFG